MTPKFRAWDKKEKQMLYDIQNAYDTLSGCVYYSNGEDAMYWESCFGDFLDNDKYVVEQWTGLTDKNGKDIYEGDILRTDDGWIQIVKRISGYVDAEKQMGTFDFRAFYVHLDGQVTIHYIAKADEVIGNIHENAELLEGKQ